jgi:threonine/homoserine/homoserine lactone efflux protein
MLVQLPEARAFVFGIILASAVGPVALLIATNSLRFGWASGIQSAVGAALGDLTYAALAATAGSGISALLQAHSAQINRAGALLLAFYGAYIVVQAYQARNSAHAVEACQAPAGFRQMQSIYVLTLVNPLTIIVFGGFIAQLPSGLSISRLTSVVASLFLGSLAVQLGIALAAGVVGSRLQNDDWIRAINLASGFGIMAFGLFGLF